MSHIIKGLIILVSLGGSFYALSRFIGKVFDPKDEVDKVDMLFYTFVGIAALGCILLVAYMVGGGQ